MKKGPGTDHLKKDWPRILHSIEVSPPRQLLLAKENYSISFFNLAPRFESEFKNRIFWLGAIHQQRPAKKWNWKNFHLKKFLFSFFHWRRRAVWPDWAIFWKFLATKILAKEAQIIGNFLGYLEKPHSYVKTALATFCTSFGKNWATFYSNIWSHWAATIVLQKSTEEANAF